MLDLGTLGLTEIIRLQDQLCKSSGAASSDRSPMAFSDIVGSTPYFARFGDAAGRELQQRHLDLLGLAAGDAQDASSTPSATARSPASPRRGGRARRH